MLSFNLVCDSVCDLDTLFDKEDFAAEIPADPDDGPDS